MYNMSSLPTSSQPSNNFSPRAKRVVTPKIQQVPEKDERDVEIERLEIDNQFLKDILSKAKLDRESLVNKISHLEQQLKLQDHVVQDVQQQRDAEKAAFRRNVENSRSSLENKYSRVQSMVKERENLLLLWTEFATASLIENPSSLIKPLLVKTCNGVPAAKEVAGNIYEHYIETVNSARALKVNRGEVPAEVPEVPEIIEDTTVASPATGTSSRTSQQKSRGTDGKNIVVSNALIHYELLVGDQSSHSHRGGKNTTVQNTFANRHIMSATGSDLERDSPSFSPQHIYDTQQQTHVQVQRHNGNTPVTPMTAAIRDISNEVNGGLQQINSLLNDAADDDKDGSATADILNGNGGEGQGMNTELTLQNLENSGIAMVESPSHTYSQLSSNTGTKVSFLFEGSGGSTDDDDSVLPLKYTGEYPLNAVVGGVGVDGSGSTTGKKRRKVVKKKRAKSESDATEKKSSHDSDNKTTTGTGSGKNKSNNSKSSKSVNGQAGVGKQPDARRVQEIMDQAMGNPSQLDDSSTISNASDLYSNNFWWSKQNNTTAGASSAHPPPSQKYSQYEQSHASNHPNSHQNANHNKNLSHSYSSSNDQSISFSDAEINRLLNGLRMQQEQQANMVQHTGVESSPYPPHHHQQQQQQVYGNKFSMNLDVGNDY